MPAGIDKRWNSARASILLCLILPVVGFAQGASDASADGTSTDLFVMFGSDLIPCGLALRASYNIGLGHTFGFLQKDPIGDEITFLHLREWRLARFSPHRLRVAHRSSRADEELHLAQD
jgi:hypothetical protein